MIPLILCGGFGTRLWPIAENKPFYNFFGQSLLEKSLHRLKKFEPFLIVSVENLKGVLEETLREKDYKTEILYEPESKNTAVSVALACRLLSLRQKEEEIIGIFPSDHFIGQELRFQNFVSTGLQVAREKQKIVTFGFSPDRACSDYGYIKVRNIGKEINGFSIKQAVAFVEKPELSQSVSLAKEGYLWNSGIFLSPVKLLIQYFSNYLPHLWTQILCVKKDFKSLHSIYQNIEPVSFDKGIMENLREYLCLPCDVAWSDLGSWNRMADLDQRFPGSLKNKACLFSKASKGNFVFSSTDKPIGLIGIKDTVIVQGEKGLLIADKKEEGQWLKSISEEFKKQNLEQKGEWVKKPWGAYRVTMREGEFKCKELKVRPGHQLSYQSHKKRSEHWLVISGLAEVTLEGKKYQLKVNEHIFIDRETKHRLKNPAKTPLFLLEIQRGSYLEEDDITRYQDDYGRS